MRRFYGLLLRLYPGGFRERYGGEMADAFAELEADTRAKGGAAAVGVLLARATWDTVRSAATEWARNRAGKGHGRRRDGDGIMIGTMQHGRQALRSLGRSPGYAAAFVLTLGLAIGVNSAVFSVVNGVLLEPLPFQDADRILYLKQPVEKAGVENATFSFIELDDYRAAASTVDEFVEFGDWSFSVVGEDMEPARLVGGLVTSNYFDVMGFQPVLGRRLNPEDDERGAEPVMVLTHDYWTRAFGRDPGVLGRMVELAGVRTRIVGVLEPGSHYTGSRRQDFYVNYSTNGHYQGAAMRDARTHRMTDVFARMAPGVDADAARSELQGIAERLHEQHPEAYPADMGYGLEVVPWKEELTRRARPTFLLLMGTVGVVLVLACANLANLTLTRLIHRERELATRGALGATGLDLRLHLTWENVVLCVAGAGAGLGLAQLSRGLLVSYASRFTVRADEVVVDWTVLGTTLAAGVAVALLLAWLPGLPVNPGAGRVSSTTDRTTQGRWGKRVQRGLVVGQLALSFTLLAGASLLVRSLVNLYSVDPGFRTENVLTVRAPGLYVLDAQVLEPPPPFGAMDRPVFEELVHRIGTYPGVRAAAASSWAPLTGRNPVALSVKVEGEDDTRAGSRMMTFNGVTAGYDEALGLRLVSGRFISAQDEAGTDSVVVINESLAEAYFGGESPLGRRLSFSLDGSHWTPWARVVGVTADAQEYGIGRTGIHTVYKPADQYYWGPSLVVSTSGDPAGLTQAIREMVREIDPDRPVDQASTLAELRAQDVAPSRLNAMLFGAFALLALLIASVGILGVLAFSVSRRIREFGIRMALGADQVRVLGSVLREALAMVVGALLLGGAGALVTGRLLSGILFDVEPVDAGSLGIAGAVLGSVALAAALLPALRATRVHPSESLKGE